MNDVKHYSTLESDDRQLRLFTWENSVCVCVCICVYIYIYICNGENRLQRHIL